MFRPARVRPLLWRPTATPLGRGAAADERAVAFPAPPPPTVSWQVWPRRATRCGRSDARKESRSSGNAAPGLARSLAEPGSRRARERSAAKGAVWLSPIPRQNATRSGQTGHAIALAAVTTLSAMESCGSQTRAGQEREAWATGGRSRDDSFDWGARRRRAIALATSRCRDIRNLRAADARDSDRRARLRALSPRPSGRPSGSRYFSYQTGPRARSTRNTCPEDEPDPTAAIAKSYHCLGTYSGHVHSKRPTRQ